MVQTRSTTNAPTEILSKNFKLKQENEKLRRQTANLKSALRAAKAEIEELKEEKRQLEDREHAVLDEAIKEERERNRINLVDQGKKMVGEFTVQVNSLKHGFDKLKANVKATCGLVKNAVEANTAEAVEKACEEFVKNITKPVTIIDRVCAGFRQIGRSLPTCHRCEVALQREARNNQPITIRPKTTPQEAPSCTICLNQFSEQPGQVPRLYRCGHTFCEDCTGKMKNGREVLCPLDRIPTLLLSHNPVYLPKNFAILDMCKQE